ncbi:DUF2834 domain-containing protein [Shewanella sp. NKUCC06_TVS]|uniref:DUF2834 domain-containing protein n=1 Tax=Shewanella sp. NKUCC06_TVS TaxID=2842128 RepID=UPI001C5BD63B|nr:DUF2834 domain-containing protein [Shewanella sp. NKUCC06_TVS]MBW3532327.1 DUF2834 domain-containing protein [Shewanella sp. NKUCC06_TVS]
MKRILFPVVALVTLVLFAGYTAYSMSQAEQSLLQFGMQLMSRLDTAQVVIDLYIMAVLACIWMVKDTQARQKTVLSVMPYIGLTLVFVSIGPLFYLVVRYYQNENDDK